MARKSIVFVGNCQVRALSQVYERFCARYLNDRVTFIESYQALTDGAREAISNADVVVEQVVDVRPQGHVDSLDTKSPRVLVPLVGCGFLWPFAGEPHPSNKKTWFNPGGPYPGENSDRYLNKLIAQGMAVDEAVDSYAALDVNKVTPLDRLYELVMDRQRRRDEICGFEIAPLIEQHFRTEQVFTTTHHPGLRVALGLAEQLFRRMGVPEEAIATMRAKSNRSPLPWAEVPIHPSVARHFGLSYIDDDTRYRHSVDGYLTFRQWVERYMRGEWNAELEEGVALVATDPKKALPKLAAGLQRSPESPDGHFARGEALRALGQFVEAEKSLRRAIELCPDEGRFHYGLSVVLHAHGKWEESLAEARVAVMQEPDNPHFFAAAAHAARLGGQLSEAENFTRQAIALDPARAGLRNLLSHLLLEQNRLAEAEEESRLAVSFDSKDFHIHLHRGRVLEALDRAEEAEQAITAAISLRPDHGGVRSHAGHLRARLKRFDDAIAAFEEAIRLEPENPAYYSGISHSLHWVGRTEDAIAAMRKTIALRPGQAGDFAHLGNLLRSIDDFAGAIASYRQAAVLAPGNAEYARLLAETQTIPVVQDDAERDAKKAQVMEGADGWLFHKIDAVLEQVCEGQGLSEGDCSRLLSLWEARHAWCRMRGISYRMLIVPERHVLYPDRLPAGITLHPQRPALRMIARADEHLRPAIVYPDEIIRQGRDVREVNYKTDVHWTMWAAYLAYRALMRTLSECRDRVTPESALTVREATRLGDMMLWLDRRERETVLLTEPPAVEVEEVFTTRTFQSGQVDVYETEQRDLPSLVLFRTSNSTHLLPFLYHHFSRIVAVASTAVHYDLLRSEKPDVVISEISERYLAPPHGGEAGDVMRFPEDFAARSFEEFTSASLPLPRSVRQTGERPPLVAGVSDLERLARELCVRDRLPETQWHLYIGRALEELAKQVG